MEMFDDDTEKRRCFLNIAFGSYEESGNISLLGFICAAPSQKLAFHQTHQTHQTHWLERIEGLTGWSTQSRADKMQR